MNESYCTTLTRFGNNIAAGLKLFANAANVSRTFYGVVLFPTHNCPRLVITDTRGGKDRVTGSLAIT